MSGGKFWGALVALLSVLMGALGLHRSGRAVQRGKQAQEDLKAVERGQRGAQRAVDQIQGGADPAKIIRQNDGRWK